MIQNDTKCNRMIQNDTECYKMIQNATKQCRLSSEIPSEILYEQGLFMKACIIHISAIAICTTIKGKINMELV